MLEPWSPCWLLWVKVLKITQFCRIQASLPLLVWLRGLYMACPWGIPPQDLFPVASNQANVGTIPNALQKDLLYQHLPFMASLPQLGIYSQPLGTHMASVNMGVLGGLTSTNPLTTVQQQNAWPIFPSMPCNHIVGSPANIVESLVVFC